MGSYPDLRPERLDQTEPARSTKASPEEEGDPLFNRAVEASYPTGSTYKLMTAMAGLENGIITARIRWSTTTATSNVGGQKFENSEGAVNGPITLVHAIEVSSDVFFYKLGARDVEHRRPAGLVGARWASAADRDRPARLGPRPKACVPSKQWTRRTLRRAKKPNEPWSPGDNIQLAVGQGDLQTDPLQMAVAYATLGNGGTVVTPHLGKEVMDTAGRVLKEIDPGPRRHVKINPEYRRRSWKGCTTRPPAPAARRPRSSKNSRSRSRARPGPPNARAPLQQVLVHLAGAVPEPQHRHRGDDRGRWLRRRIGGPRQRSRSCEAYSSKKLKKEAEEETKESEANFEGEARSKKLL